jgi:Fe-S cluster assembly protein SufD
MAFEMRAMDLAPLRQAYEKLLAGEHCLVVNEKGSELSWLRRAREQAAEKWQTDGLPRKTDERWKYLNLAAFEHAQFSVSEPAEHSAIEDIDFPALVEGGAGSIKLVFINGYFSRTLSQVRPQAGVSVTVLSELVENCVANGWNKEGLRKLENFKIHVQNSDANRENTFVAMNMSFFHDAVLIQLEPGAQAAEPIIVYHFSDFTSNSSADLVPMTSPRIFVDLGVNSQAAVLECFAASRATAASGARYFNNAVSDIFLEQGARISHACLQCESDTGMQIATTRVRQMKNSFCETYHFALGGDLARHDLHIELEGEGAEAILDGLYLSDGRRQVDNYTFVEHVVPHTTSAQLYKGVLDGESRSAFLGRVRIHPDAQKSSAFQLNKNLLLSAKAEIDTRPELEIDADDVKAVHGATVGRIDSEQIFYFQTRAIARAEAEKILVFAFTAEIAMRIRNKSLREMLVDALTVKLRGVRNDH